MRDVVQSPDKRERQFPGAHGGTVYRFSKVRYESKLIVVAELKGEDCWLVTCFYE